jgi:inosine-uridine nucleoside N-ribohydrolase
MIFSVLIILFVKLCELVMHADDAMAIFLALRSPEVEVIGLTTIYGNVYTTLATRNALHLV